MIRCGNQKCRRWIRCGVLVTATGKTRKYPVCHECHAKAVKGHERAVRAIFPNKGHQPQEG